MAPSHRAGKLLLAALVNGLSIGRLGLALTFPWVPDRWRLPAILAGGFSDLADGWVSRRFRVTSTFGQVLDPVADKAFVGMVLLTLWADGRLATWQALLVVFRDLAVAGGSAWEVLRKGRGAATRMPPTVLGKLATAAQFVFLVALVYHRGAGPVAPAAFAAAAGLSVAAGVGYLRRGAVGPARGGGGDGAACDCSATTSTRGSAAATGSTASSGSSTSSSPRTPT